MLCFGCIAGQALHRTPRTCIAQLHCRSGIAQDTAQLHVRASAPERIKPPQLYSPLQAAINSCTYSGKLLTACTADCVGWGMQEVMTHLCTGDQPALPKPAVLAGAVSLLNTMGVEDVMGDAPKAADWVRAALPVCMFHSVKHVYLALTTVSRINGAKVFSFVSSLSECVIMCCWQYAEAFQLLAL